MTTQSAPAYTHRFWAKAHPYRTQGPERIHLLEHHLADVGACFEALLAQPTIARRLAHAGGREELDATTAARLSLLAAMHDVGKVNVGFQTQVWRNARPPHREEVAASGARRRPRPRPERRRPRRSRLVPRRPGLVERGNRRNQRMGRRGRRNGMRPLHRRPIAPRAAAPTGGRPATESANLETLRRPRPPRAGATYREVGQGVVPRRFQARRASPALRARLPAYVRGPVHARRLARLQREVLPLLRRAAGRLHRPRPRASAPRRERHRPRSDQAAGPVRKCARA